MQQLGSIPEKNDNLGADEGVCVIETVPYEESEEWSKYKG